MTSSEKKKIYVLDMALGYEMYFVVCYTACTASALLRAHSGSYITPSFDYASWSWALLMQFCVSQLEWGRGIFH